MRIVLGADGFGALERHVLEHVRDAGLAAGIVHRAGVHVGVERDDRRFVPLENDEVQPVGKRELGDALFEILERLRDQREREHQQEEKLDCEGFHAGFWLSQVTYSLYCTGIGGARTQGFTVVLIYTSHNSAAQ